ncbi:hypothetical protein E2C01_055495 [Portunus trituberculatus]|uniref:Uncharacterized protein n=1 Tax=Portunus trituberculatus TaxID=210409 RepID=A0A5B7GUW5_PORTR|nr:hypothetical protein [Portunus trituberculatus]
MAQWIRETTRVGGNEEALRVDLLFTKEIDVIEEMKYQCPQEKSDHLLTEFSLDSGSAVNKNELHKNDRYNYGKADSTELREYFTEGIKRYVNQN